MRCKLQIKGERSNSEAGMSVVEYALLIALLSVCVIASINAMMGSITSLFQTTIQVVN